MRPDRKSLKTLLKEYNPQPGEQFYKRMSRTPWAQKNVDEKGFMKSRFNFVRLGLILLAAILVLGIAAFSIPSVRAAISAYLGLGIAPGDVVNSPVLTITSSGETALATAFPTAQAGLAVPVITPSLESTLPSVTPIPQAGQATLTPTWLPEGYSFGDKITIPEQKMVVLTYLAKRQLPGNDPNLTETRTLTLAESPLNTNIPLQVAPSTSLEDITVNGAPAAYAVGAWDSQFVPDPNNPKGGSFQAQWRNDLPIQNVFWQSGPLYLALISDDPALSKDDLIRIASSVK